MTRRLFELALNTVCECFLVFCAIVMLLTGGWWYVACALFILLGCLYRLYRALCPTLVEEHERKAQKHRAKLEEILDPGLRSLDNKPGGM